MKPEIDDNKIVIFAGAGISVESGISAFSGSDGLWGEYDVELVCARNGFENNPEFVTKFYNNLKQQIVDAKPNAAHIAIADLEKSFKVTVITTNIDNFFEMCGCSNVIHVHGNLQFGKSHLNQDKKVFLGNELIGTNNKLDGVQLRHDVVFYGETPENIELAKNEIKTAGKVLVVGSSLSVSPSNTILKHARFQAEKVVVDVNKVRIPYGYKMRLGTATSVVPEITKRWIDDNAKLQG